MPHILIVDDDLELLESAKLLLVHDYHVTTASSVLKAQSILLQSEFDVAIVDLNFEGQEEDGICLLDFICKKLIDIEVVILSADQVTSRIVEAMRRNLVDFIPKTGAYGNALKLAVAKGLEKKRQRKEKFKDQLFLTNSPSMKSLLKFAQKIAESPNDFPILITGETGTGKEVLAKYLASLLNKPIVTSNMASIPKEMAESELFGHLKGAFTGATQNKAGLIELAHNGIFFLDEIGECDLSLQAKLLRVIQEKEFRAVGGTKTKTINVRFISATNRKLEKMVEDQAFRLDLFHRLNIVELKIPPLRERPEDIILYTNKFLIELSNGKSFHLTNDAITTLLSHSWPGNVRELRGLIEKLIIVSDKLTIDAQLIIDSLRKESTPPRPHVEKGNIRSQILDAMELEKGNRTKAAARLSIHTVTLQRWLKKLGLTDIYKAKNGRPAGLQRITE